MQCFSNSYFTRVCLIFRKREQLVTDTLTAESFFSDFRLEGDAEYVSEMDWEVPAVSEEAIGRLTTMFTIYPK